MSEMFWRGKRIEDLTHEECIECIRQLGQRNAELEALSPYVDWRGVVLGKMNAKDRKPGISASEFGLDFDRLTGVTHDPLAGLANDPL